MFNYQGVDADVVSSAIDRYASFWLLVSKDSRFILLKQFYCFFVQADLKIIQVQVVNIFDNHKEIMKYNLFNPFSNSK